MSDTAPSTITIKTLDEDNRESSIEIFMSYGLLNHICGVVGSLEHVGRIDTDADLAGSVTLMCMVPRKKNGKLKVDLDNYDPPGLSIEEAERLLDWVKEHVTDFFARRVNSTVKLFKDREDVLRQMKSSVTGLESKISETSSG